MLNSRGLSEDKELSLAGEEIVWYSDAKVLKTLAYHDNWWVVQGYLSTKVRAKNSKAPEPDVYHNNVGYMLPPVVCYGFFSQDTPDDVWQHVYSKITAESVCSLFEICEVIRMNICGLC